MDKELFISAINWIIAFNTRQEIFNNAIQTFCQDKDFSGFFLGMDFWVDTLEKLMDDKGQTISWWLYEARFEPETYTIESAGKEFILRTPEDLYNYLIKEN